MPEKASFDYIDNDPLVSVTLINPAFKKKVKAFAYLDTGSDTVVIPRELWLKLGWKCFTVPMSARSEE